MFTTCTRVSCSMLLNYMTSANRFRPTNKNAKNKFQPTVEDKLPGPTSTAMRSATASSGSQDLPILATFQIAAGFYKNSNGKKWLLERPESIPSPRIFLESFATLAASANPALCTWLSRVFLRTMNGPSIARYCYHLSSSTPPKHLLKSHGLYELISIDNF